MGEGLANIAVDYFSLLGFAAIEFMGTGSNNIHKWQCYNTLLMEASYLGRMELLEHELTRGSSSGQYPCYIENFGIPYKMKYWRELYLADCSLKLMTKN